MTLTSLTFNVRAQMRKITSQIIVYIEILYTTTE